MMQRLELSRPYFEREARFGCRVIFQWTPATRWPERPCPGGSHDDHPAWCPLCRNIPALEGVQFTDEAAAQTFDLDKTSSIDDAGAWAEFATWEDGERWLRGEGW